MNLDRAWMSEGACRGHDPELWSLATSNPSLNERALAICAACPVRAECLDAAMDENPRDDHTIRGGTLPVHRRSMLRGNRNAEQAMRAGDAIVEQARRPTPPPPAPAPPPVSLGRVLAEVAADHHLDVDRLVSRDRSNVCVHARRDVMVRLRREGMSLQAIGSAVGGRHHVTVLHHLRKVGAA